MEYTIKKHDELKAFGYKDLGVFVAGTREIRELIENRYIYNSILIKKLDIQGNIISIFAK